MCQLTLPPPTPMPDGPFTVTVSDASGAMFEVVFPDYRGELPHDANILGCSFEGSSELLCNLLAGAMRVYLGRQ